MCRSGMQFEEIKKIYNERSIIKKFNEVIIFTHLASADEKNSKYNSISMFIFNYNTGLEWIFCMSRPKSTCR